MSVTVVSEEELRALVGLDMEALGEIKRGFSLLSAGKVEQPPIMRLDVPEHEGEVDVKSACVRGLDSLAVKISSGFFGNRQLGLSSGSGLMVLLSSETGRPLAVLLDNGYLTDVRTALAGAVAGDLLARRDPGLVAGIVGAGTQARFQLRALTLVRTLAAARVWARDQAQADRYCAEMSADLGIPVTAAASVDELAAGSDLLVTTTPAREPLVRGEWLREGLHVTAMGSDAEHKQELDDDVLARADVVVCDSREQAFRLGELRAAAGRVPWHDVAEIGELLADERPGRSNDRQLTVCDLTGTGTQDTMIARLAYQRARRAASGDDQD